MAEAPSLGVKGPMQQWVESSVLQLNLTESSSVQQWLFDIRMNTDCESMCILQGKSIHTSPVNLEMTANTIKENVLRLKTASKCLSAKFGQLHVKLAERSEGILESCSAICKEIYCVVKECEGFFLEIPSNLFSQQQSLVQETSQFKRLIEELESDVHGTLHPESHLTDQLLKLGEQCAVFVEIVQTKLIQALVYSVQDSASELNIMVSVKTVHSLITDYPSIKPILLQEQVISALFQVCLQTSFTVNSVQLLSLQTIAKFCQDTDGRIETEKIGGIGYLSQIISSPTSSESLRIEAAALISQLTAPEIVSDFRQSRFHQHLEVLLRALTDLMEQSRDPLVFLVASSAVANITFMGSIVFEFLAQDNAAKILVEGSKEGKVESLNIKDQVVTIFANMAEDQACRESIKQYEGIPLLIELLQTQVAGFETEDNKQASDEVIHDAKLCEQIQQKSAIALARLSKDKTCAAEIKQLEGISIFSRICRTSSYRNKSVPVLIACLAALRRLHHALGPSSFHQDDIDILVRPKMIESIFSCSSMSEESFV